MNLIELRAENFARLVAVEIRPDGAMVPITGANKQGKTTVLKAIWSLVLGRSAAPAVAIRKDAEEATLFGDFGSYKVTRTIKRDAAGDEQWTLKIVQADGKRITTSPQKVIDGWLGALTFDPLEFARMDAKAQFDKLRGLVKGFDFDDKAKKRKDLFDRRTDSNRYAQTYQTQADAVVLPAGPKPKPVDVAAKVTELEVAGIANRDSARHRDFRRSLSNEIDRLRDEAETMRARAAGLEKQATTKQVQLDGLAADPQDIDTAALIAEINTARAVAGVIALHDDRAHKLQMAKEATEESEFLTRSIAIIDEEKEGAIAAAKLPVKGLTLGDGEVLLDGLPFGQASTMEKIVTGAALGMAMNPELKVMTIDEASELDSKAMARLKKMAEDKGFTIWFTKVDESGEVGFVIEDGSVAAVGEMPR